jgi:hypothetical protein
LLLIYFLLAKGNIQILQSYSVLDYYFSSHKTNIDPHSCAQIFDVILKTVFILSVLFFHQQDGDDQSALSVSWSGQIQMQHARLYSHT